MIINGYIPIRTKSRVFFYNGILIEVHKFRQDKRMRINRVMKKIKQVKENLKWLN